MKTARLLGAMLLVAALWVSVVAVLIKGPL